MNESAIIRDLGDGLIVRRSTAQDAEALAQFNAWIHGDMEAGWLEEKVAAWTRDLLTQPHPTFDPGDFTIVEDTRTGKIVSSLNLISQTWQFAGIPFKVGRPELVGTDPAYRHRGLVRAQFEIIHQWSAGRGEMVQAITGIPYYYRLFGYEMALNLGGSRVGGLVHVKDLAENEQESTLVRPAEEADLPFIAETYRYGCERSLIACQWTHDLFRYEIMGKSANNVNRMEVRLITSKDGERLGFLAHANERWGAVMSMNMYELKPGISWAAVTPAVLRYLRQTGLTLQPGRGDAPLGEISFHLGEAHPAYEVMGNRLPRVNPPYAWYIRVPNLVGFVRHIAPALEARLAASPLAGHSGELKLSFYQDGLHFVFENGCLASIERWKPTPEGHSGSAAFPGLTFLQLLFGYRSLAELRYAFADCFTTNEDVRMLIHTLFPRHPSDLWAIS